MLCLTFHGEFESHSLRQPFIPKDLGAKTSPATLRATLKIVRLPIFRVLAIGGSSHETTREGQSLYAN